MPQNIIILTSGLTGSSVLTGLISQAGYWTGDSTVKKKDYDTFENAELISHNLQIFKEAEFTGDYLMQYSPEAISRIDSLSNRIDCGRYREFIAKCSRHEPWVWKDPRLWMTIHFWKDILDLKQCKFLVLSRNFRQLWVSTILRRQIVSYQGSKSYEQHVTDSILRFLEQNRLSYQQVRYEDLIVQPAKTIPELNAYLGTQLTVDNLKAIYHKPLHKLPASSPTDLVKALLIYLKNYPERVDAHSRG